MAISQNFLTFAIVIYEVFSKLNSINLEVPVNQTLFIYPGVFNSSQDKFTAGTFPPWFKFGSATSSYQTEGAWNVNGKSESVWDRYTHSNKEQIKLGNGDNATNSYYFFHESDLNMVKDLGLKMYRFSLSWPRLLPNGTIKDNETDVNPKGVEFYNKLIDSLIENDIEPMVTLFHWDLPQKLQDSNGGQISDEFPNWFANYADFCFRTFGDRVKKWLTFNEPYINSQCYENASIHCAPGVISPGVKSYINGHHEILAHVKTYHLYKEKYFKEQGGKVGIVIGTNWFEPVDKSKKNKEAQEKVLLFRIGWMLSPLLKNGDFPRIMKEVIGRQSLKQGFAESRLPEFTEEQKQQNLGSLDFLGLNYYGAKHVSYIPQINSDEPSIKNDQSVHTTIPEGWVTMSGFGGYKVFPEGLRKSAKWVMDNYGQKVSSDFEIIITENGYASPPATCANSSIDLDRVKYVTAHLNQIYKSIVEDKINITGYIYWSLMDTYNFGSGYTKKFGLFCTNFASTTQQKFPRYSATFYQDVIKNHGFNDSYFMMRLQDLGILATDAPKQEEPVKYKFTYLKDNFAIGMNQNKVLLIILMTTKLF